MKRKILSIVICLAMLISTFAMMPMTASAAGTDQTTESVTNDVHTESATDNAAIPQPKVDNDVETIIGKPGVNFTNVAPFLPAVEGKAEGKAEAVSFLAKPAMMMRNAVDNPQLLADEPEADNGLELSKTASALDEEGKGTITLEAYATGETITSTVEKDIPTDIVLVLDHSTSMKLPFNLNEASPVGNGATNHTLYNYYVGNGEAYYGINLFYRNDDGSFSPVQVGMTTDQHQSDTTYYYLAYGAFGGNWQASSGNMNGSPFTNGTEYDPNWDWNKLYYIPTPIDRMTALKDTLGGFITDINRKADPDDMPGSGDEVNHRVAVVGFGSRATSLSGGLQDMDTSDGQNRVTAAVNGMTANGSTMIDDGMNLAEEILNSNPISEGEKRNRVVIAFTDGYPGSSNDSLDWNVGDRAIEISGDIKEKGTSVYTVGIFPGADSTNLGSREGTVIEQANNFMQNLSSNNGEVADPSFYLSASDTNALNAIFKQISDEIESGGSSIELGSSAVVKDVMSDYFILPAGTDASDIVVKTAKYKGGNTGSDSSYEAPVVFADAQKNVDIENNTVSVTNFDFAENYVGMDKDGATENPHGYKLIIEIPYQVRDGFYGGNGVPTNDAASGVYENIDADSAIEDFKKPKVDVKLNVPAFTGNEKTIYYGGTLDPKTLYNEVILTESEAWKDDYVNVTYDAPVSVDNTNCSDNDVSITLTPRNTGAATAKTEIKQAKVHVLVPQITYQDSTIYLGEIADYADNTPANNVEWVDKNGHTGIPAVTGTAPGLSFEYTPVEGVFKEDTPVNATVKIGSVNITNVVIFKNGTATHLGSEEKPEFTVHVETCTLTIDKDVEGTIDKNQSFIFKVKGDDTNDYSKVIELEVVIQEDGTATITGLPVGTYTVNEDGEWSWRYKLEGTNGKSCQLTSANPVRTVTFTNNREINKWLNGNAYCENHFNEIAK